MIVDSVKEVVHDIFMEVGQWKSVDKVMFLNLLMLLGIQQVLILLSNQEVPETITQSVPCSRILLLVEESELLRRCGVSVNVLP